MRVQSAAPPNVSQHWGPCAFTRTGTHEEVRLTSTATLAGKPLTLTEQRTRDEGLRVHNVAIDVGGKRQFEFVQRKTKGAAHAVATLTLGVGFGYKEFVLTSDGKTISGRINGRAIIPFAISSNPKAPRFADGRPAPTVHGSRDIAEAVTAAFKRAATDTKKCVPPATSRRTRARRTSGPFELAQVDETWAGAEDSPGCQDCQNGCTSTFNTCAAAAEIGAASSCWWSFGIGCAAAAAALFACGQAEGSCTTNCSYSYACCPVQCQHNVDPDFGPSQCCSANLTCVDPVNGWCCPTGDKLTSNGICCPPSLSVCKGVCCAKGQVCSTQGICCKQLHFNTQPVSCNGQCCAAGQGCAPSAASYPNAKSEPATCCPSHDIRHGKCCSGVSTGRARWCGDLCCTGPCDAAGTGCAALCLSGIPCGSKCCGPGYICADAKTSTCKKKACAHGQYACSDINSRLVVCCPKGQTCAAGTCCAKGQVACSNSAGTWGCWPHSQCMVQAPPK